MCIRQLYAAKINYFNEYKYLCIRMKLYQNKAEHKLRKKTQISANQIQLLFNTIQHIKIVAFAKIYVQNILLRQFPYRLLTTFTIYDIWSTRHQRSHFTGIARKQNFGTF